MKTVLDLIALARAKVHTDRELAARIGVDPSELTEMKKGRRPVSPETVAMLCDVLELPGSEAREWLAISIIENPKNASKLGALKKALFACWALGVGVSLSMTSTTDVKAAEADASMTTSISDHEVVYATSYSSVTNDLHIVAYLAGLLRRAAAAARCAFRSRSPLSLAVC